MPTTVTETIGTNSRDYSTISAWEAATDNDLVTADEVRVGEVYDDSDFDEQFTIAGATTDSTRYRILTVAEGHRHNGQFDTGAIVKLTDTTATEPVFVVDEANSWLRWLEFYWDVTTTNFLDPGYVVSGESSGSHASHLMVRFWRGDDDLAFGSRIAGIALFDTVSCCIVDDIEGVANDTGSFWSVGIYNSDTVHNCMVTFIQCSNGGSGNGFAMGYDSNTTEVKNCVALDMQADTSGFCFHEDATTNSNNASDDGTGGTSPVSVAYSDFVSSADYHTVGGSNLLDAGEDLGDVRAKIDIDGEDRHAADTAWDIGVDQILPVAESVSDGANAGDSVASRLVKVESVGDTTEAGDSFTFEVKQEESGSEGIEVGDSFTFRQVFRPSPEDGGSIGDTVSHNLQPEESPSDGVEVDDSVSIHIAASDSLSDQIQIGDAAAFVFGEDHTEVVEFGDTVTDVVPGTQVVQESVSDGVQMGEGINIVSGDPTLEGGRTLSAPILTTTESDHATVVHLIEMTFYDDGTQSENQVRLTTAPQDVDATVDIDGSPTLTTFTGAGGLLEFGTVSETSDRAGQGTRVSLSGVDQSIIATLLNNQFRGRDARIWRLYLNNDTGQPVDDPIILFKGKQLSDYNITEDWGEDMQPGTVRISTKVSSRLSELQRTNDVRTNVVSHNQMLQRAGIASGTDTFFRHVPSLVGKKVYWGTKAPDDATDKFFGPLAGGGTGSGGSGAGHQPGSSNPLEEAAN